MVATGVSPAERQRPGEQLVHHDAQRVEVAAEVHLVPAQLLRAHVLRRAHEGARGGDRGPARPRPVLLGDPEVHHAHDPGVVAHEVRGLEVAVDDAHLVDRAQAVGDLQRGAPGLRRREPAPLAGGPREVLALDELHADVEEPPVLAVAVDRADVAVAHAAGEADLRPEALLVAARLARHVGAKDLDRHRLAQLAVEGAVDHAHPAAAQGAQDLEARGEQGPVGEAGEGGIEGGTAGEAGLRGRLVVGTTGETVHRPNSS